MRRHLILGLAVAGVLGCQTVQSPVGTEPLTASRKPPVGQPSSRGNAASTVGTDVAGSQSVDGASLIGLDGASLIGLDGASLIGLDGASLIGLDGASLSGELKLPPALIGLDGASLIGLDGASLIGLDGASLVGLDGASYQRSERVSPYGLKALAERPVEGAWVYLRDGEGRFVVGADKQLVRARTDASGRFLFPNLKASRGIFLFASLGRKQGQLLGVSAVMPKDQTAPVRMDTASTMLASWIVEEILAKQSDKGESLSRLPAFLNAEAVAAVAPLLGEQAVVSIGQGGAKGSAMTVRELAAKPENSGFSGLLEDVRRVMTLAGLDLCQDGVDATQVPAPLPGCLAAAPDGGFFVLTEYTGFVMRVSPQGVINQVAGPCAGRGGDAQKEHRALSHLLVGPDKKLYMASTLLGRIWRSDLDGTGDEEWLRIVSGSTESPRVGDRPQGKAWGAFGLMAPANDGTMWLGFDEQPTARLIRLSAAGNIAEIVEGPRATETMPRVRKMRSLAHTPDGALWLLAQTEGGGSSATLYRRAAGDAEWSLVSLGELAGDLNAKFSYLLAEPDSTALVSVSQGEKHGIYRISSVVGTPPERVVGAGPIGVNLEPVAAKDARFNRPTFLARRTTDGAVLVTDYYNNLVRAWVGDVVKVVGGTGVAQRVVGADTFLKLPTGLTLDPQGRPVITEAAGSTVRRLQERMLVTIAGGEFGFTGHERASAKRLGAPIDLAAVGDDFFVVEMDRRCLRRLYANGEIETLAGGGRQTLWDGEKRSARDYDFVDILAVTAFPDGRPVFSAQMRTSPGERVFEGLFRVETDGSLTHLAGAPSSSSDFLAQSAPIRSGPGKETSLGKILSLAVGPDLSIYMGDVRKCQVVRLTPAGQIEPVAGGGIMAIAQQFSENSYGTQETEPALQAGVVAPSGLAFDAQGRLLIAEAGTASFQGYGKLMDTPLLPEETFPALDGRLRRLEPDGRLVTVAGVGAPGREKLVVNPLKIQMGAEGTLIFIEAATGQIKSLRLGD